MAANLTTFLNEHVLNRTDSQDSSQKTLNFIESHTPFYHWLENTGLKAFYQKAPELILQALTHTSYDHENKDWTYGHNERLEFLGDAVLDHELSHILWRDFPHLKEGELSRLRSSVVNEDVLATWARMLDLPGNILLGKGELNKGRVENAICADALEALFGAVSLIDRQAPAELLSEWIKIYDERKNKEELILLDERRLYLFDPKTRLQELTLELYKETPRYKSFEQGEGFSCQCLLGQSVLGEGQGTSKKRAEVAAAKEVLIKETYKNL